MTGKMHSYFNGRRFRTLIFQSLAVALLLIVGLVPVAHAQESTAAPSSGEVSVVRLNLRTEPSISSPVAGRLAQNDAVDDSGRSATTGDWYQMPPSATTAAGWVFAVYVNHYPDDRGAVDFHRNECGSQHGRRCRHTGCHQPCGRDNAGRDAGSHASQRLARRRSGCNDRSRAHERARRAGHQLPGRHIGRGRYDVRDRRVESGRDVVSGSRAGAG